MNGLLFLVGLTVLVAVAQSQPLSGNDVLAEWEAFKTKHGKKYVSDDVEAIRKAIFMDNKKKIAEHNARYARGEESFTVGINRFADMVSHEVAQKFNGYRQMSNRRFNRTILTATQGSLPQTVDWRQAGIVTPVKNQEQCGGCWAFSATGSMEGQNALATGQLVSLSEQNLIDCSDEEGNEGCNGGLMDAAFEYVIQNGGIDTEDSYPFVTYYGGSEACQFNPNTVGATMSSFVDIDSGSESSLKQAVATVGPISAAIDASSNMFNFYSGGVFNYPQCSSTELDHGILVVGYGTENGQDYWLVKNSWGTDWGENGYIKMSRNQNNQCGIATEASYPVV